MSTIKKRHVRRSRKEYQCQDCFEMIEKGSEYVYLYGMAHDGEVPYPLWICVECYARFENTRRKTKW